MKRHFEFKDALEGALGSPLGSIWEGSGGFGNPFGVFAGSRGHPEFPKLYVLAPLNPNFFARTILDPKPGIFKNRAFAFVKLRLLKVKERNSRIKKTSEIKKILLLIMELIFPCVGKDHSYLCSL